MATNARHKPAIHPIDRFLEPNARLKVCTIPPEALARILNRIPERKRQAFRFVKFLANNPRTRAGDVMKVCSLSNPSHVRRKVSPYLALDGYVILCESPENKLFNRFGDPSEEQLWSVYCVDESANDSEGGDS